MSVLRALITGLTTTSAAATEAVGRGIAAELPAGTIIGLVGDLGAGKTTLVRGIAAAYGHFDITSPSFNYYFAYPANPAKQQRPLIHLDAYRLRGAADYPSLMIEEQITPQTLFIVEWPERLDGILSISVPLLSLSINPDCTHLIKWQRAPAEIA